MPYDLINERAATIETEIQMSESLLVFSALEMEVLLESPRSAIEVVVSRSLSPL